MEREPREHARGQIAGASCAPDANVTRRPGAPPPRSGERVPWSPLEPVECAIARVALGQGGLFRWHSDCVPVVGSVEELERAAADFAVVDLGLVIEPAALAAARRSLAESGFLLLGEVHGVRENPLVIRALMRAFGLTGLALEWPAELAPAIGAFLAGERLADHPLLWFGDGRITAGHRPDTATRPVMVWPYPAAGPDLS